MTDQRFLSPEGWPQPKGYANGVATRGRFVFVAGQVGWNPVTAKFETDDLVEQVAQALRNIVTVLRAGVAEPGHITRLTWYVTDKQAYLNAQAQIGEGLPERSRKALSRDVGCRG